MTLLFFMLNGCRKPVVLNTESIVQSVQTEQIDGFEPSGAITNDSFTDFDHELVVPIETGWVAEIGKRNEAFRLRLKHEMKADLEIEFWSFEGRYDEPIPSERCQWSFTDNGYYTQYKFAEKTIVASCEYNHQSKLVFAVIIPTNEQTWQVEIHTSSQNMISNLNTAHQQLRNASIIQTKSNTATPDENAEQNDAEK